METNRAGYVVNEADVEWEHSHDPAEGILRWRTLTSADRAPTDSLTSGVAEIDPGEQLALHRHAQAEIYYLLQGRGIMTIDGMERPVGPGMAVFIPGNAEHGIRNVGTETLRFFYAFAVNSFDQVEYVYERS
jgi:mannose-6-phosphate isomerase-like protein (cupin superfamily)